MRQAKKHSLPQRSASVMKAAMGVLLTSAFMLLPTARADETATEKPEAQLSKGELKAQRQFKMLDFNHDGKLSRSEVAIIPKLAAAFDETDTNKDGFVSYEEVRAFAVKYRAERGLDKTKAAAKTPAAAPSPAAAPEPAASQSEAAGAEPESK
ncbi:EF-hand domain-containing protein [Comamonas sp. Y6]|uniref:EF-hand domain-containing protein n=2 Tax=Comamonas resistens TaxID=3046670 RepID=A0ABY8SXS4_9BURK|nr:EF-hand domain-containing protein [Comamonas resistens]MDL5036096.1 EF-hand domain-containing protein [Comamonas resistens]WHS67847.1 EF-hand domain-containing protein [Comamonas resistens]